MIIPQEKFWMEPADAVAAPAVLFYRNRFRVERETELALRYSADERCVLFLDGERVADGPERGAPGLWYYGKLSVAVAPGEHTLTARVLMLGETFRPMAQCSVRCGLFVEERSRLLDARWECRIADCCRYTAPQPDWGTVPRLEVQPGYEWGLYRGEGEGWREAVRFADRRELHAPALPAMRCEPVMRYEWDGRMVRFSEYMLYHAEYEFSGEGTVEIRYFEHPESRPEETCAPEHYRDRFTLPGGRVRHHDLWFRAGQALEFRFSGNAKLEQMSFRRTGYPYRWNVDFHDDAPGRRALLAAAKRTLECCTWETYMDCPYYEQLQYVADSRIEMLSGYAVTGDRRPMEKALRLLALGQRSDGALACRYPARDRQENFVPCEHAAPLIPGFSLLYIQQLHDFARLRHNDALVRELLPAARRIAAHAAGHLDGGILRRLPGWNFLDWRPDWKNGIPPFCEEGGGCTLNWLFVQSLRDLADLERNFGSAVHAAAYEQQAAELERAVTALFYDEARGCFAEDQEHRYFSEHAQVFAILTAGRTDLLPLLRKGELDKCGIYFSFYYFEVCRLHGLDDCFARRLASYEKLALSGLSTLPEEFRNWRSFCHAWSAHYLYFHYSRDSFTERISHKTSTSSSEAAS